MEPLKYWKPETFEISSYMFHLSEKINNTFRRSGSDETGLCVYTYNELGFRGDSITKEGFKIMVIGDSNTEGVGVNNNETWSSQFCSLVPNSVNHNFGMGGRSNDYISRCLLTYYDIINPDLVLIMYTSPHRREIFTNDCGIEPYMLTSTWGYLKHTEEGRKIQDLQTEIQNDNEDFVNWYKNHLLIKYFLETKKCNWLWNGWMGIPTEYQEFNRFDGFYAMPFLDLGVDGAHPGVKHNKKYSNDLYEYIMKNFINYLPKDKNLKVEKKLV
jgi:lysophospholipase L1-like esterase